MTTGSSGWGERVARGVIAVGALLVPPGRRDAWREEWEGEVWHHRESGGGGAALVARCLGAIPHAIWIWGEEWNVDTIVQDIRFAMRTLVRRPVFALVAVGTLALGIGGNTAVFSVVNAVLLRPLPLNDADRLVWVWGRDFNGQPGASVSPPDYLDFREESGGVFETLAAHTSFSERLVYDGGERPVELTARGVTHDFLDALGEQPALGRGFTADETRAAETGLVMLSHGLWGRLYGFDPGVVGTTIPLDGTPHTIVGVLPEDLSYPAGTDLWMPLTFGADWYGSRAGHFLRPIGKLRAGVRAGDAQQALAVVAARLEAEFPETNEDWYPVVQPLQEVFVGSVRPALLVLLTAVGVVLLIACGNVANLLLARAVARRGEVAVRAALGASRGRVVRQLMTESLLLATAAGLAGVGVAHLGIAAFARLQPGNVPRVDEVGLDPTVLGFTALLSLCVGILFGLAPALGLASGDVSRAVRASGRGHAGRGSRARSVLIGAEIALSFVLVTGAALLTRSFAQLRAVDPGIEPEGVVALSLTFGDRERADVPVALDGILERVRAEPGVLEAGAATLLPFSGSGGDTYVYAEGRPPAQIQNVQNTALIRTVDEAYFRALGMRIVGGRTFESTDATDAPPRVVINETLATRLFPNEDPLGRRMVAGLDTFTALEVMGVVEDVRQFNLGTPSMAEFFLSARQYPPSSVQLVARGDSGAPPSLAALREAVWDVDPTQPLARAASLGEMVDSSLAPGRFQAWLLGAFSALAVLLAGVGLYGVLAEGVNEERREIGVRMAMGAEPSQVVRGVVARGLRVALFGLAVGLVGSLAATRLLTSLLYGVSPRDPLTFALTPIFLCAVVVVSSWLPAYQASCVEPVRALREEA